MNTKKICAILAVVSLVMPVVALAELPAPTNVTVNVAAGVMAIDWDDVVGATKYSVDLEGEVTFYNDLLPGVDTAYVELSFGTSDRTDGLPIGESNLSILLVDIRAAIAAQLGVDVEDVLSVDGLVKVKALAPGKGNGAQDNPFSDPLYGVLVF